MNRKLQALGSQVDLRDLLVTGVALNLLLTGVSSLVGPWRSVTIAVVLAGVIVAMGVVSSRRSRRRRLIGEAADPEQPRRGLVLTLSLRSAEPGSVALRTIERLRPEYVGLLGSQITDTQRISARLVQALARSARLDPVVRSEIVDPVDVNDCKHATARLIQWMLDQGLTREDILLDLTAGTAVMSLGAFLSSEEFRVDTQYEASDYDDRMQRIPGSERPIYVAHYLESHEPAPNPATEDPAGRIQRSPSGP
ncbi:MAG: hypothetical protein ACRDYX_07405 [Egibacteraceae bacterium]